jgi:hypothetical protein
MSEHTHHHSLLAGVGAGTAAVLVGGACLIAVWHRVAGPVGTAVLVIVLAATVAVILAVVAAAVYAFLWLRHRVLHPEVLARPPSVRAEVMVAEPAPQPGAASVPIPYAEPAAIEPGREVHLHLNVTPGQLAAIMRHHTEEDQ